MKGPISAEIRHISGEEWDGLYINGTLVAEDEYLNIGTVFRILRNNLNTDARSFVLDSGEFYDTYDPDGENEEISYPKRLSELEPFIDHEDLGE